MHADGPSPRPPSPRRFVSRAGEKLARALEVFGLDVAGLRCCDFGCNVGGFTDCLVQAGASEVIAIDTGYGTLAWSLRSDPRVVVRERTNALHADPADAGAGDGVDLVVIDLAWTPQRLSVPAALRWLRPGGRIVTLIKPHYEWQRDFDPADPGVEGGLVDGVLTPALAEAVTQRVLDGMPGLGARVLDRTISPITGRKSRRRARSTTSDVTPSVPGAIGPGNVEFLALLVPLAAAGQPGDCLQ